jgi:hypothetical protein
LQVLLNRRGERVRASEHAPGGPFRVLERRHGFAEIVERGGGVLGTFAAATAPHHTSPAQQIARSVRIEIGEPIPTGIGVGPAFLMVAFAAAIFLCFAWGASTAPAPRAPEL